LFFIPIYFSFPSSKTFLISIIFIPPIYSHPKYFYHRYETMQ